MPHPPTRFDELKATGELPSPTGIALEILRLARRPETTAKDLTHILQADPALTGKLLRLANSSYVGLSRPATSIADAVMRLGMRTVSTVSLAFSILGTSRCGVCQTFDYDGFWAVSLARAVASEAINRRLKIVSGEDGFTLGLLSHIGELALATVYPEQYGKILQERAVSGHDELWIAERDALGISSRDLSAAMFADWRLPEIFVDALLETLEFSGKSLSSLPRSRQLGVVLEASDQIARQYVAAAPASDGQEESQFSALLGPLGITGGDAEECRMAIAVGWREWGQLLALPNHPRSLPPRYLQPSPAATTCSPSADGAEAPAPLDVIVADDDELQRQLMSKLLQASGCTVRIAGDGQQALELVLQHRPDIVIADWQMPRLDGLELCRTLRQSQVAQGVHVILVTAADAEEVLVDAFEAGVDDFVTKPLRPRAFQARLKAARRLIRLEAAYEAEQRDFRRVAGELAVANRKLEQAMLTDFLTGLPNRRCLIDRLEQELASASRNQRDLSCLVIDVDHFKQINDRFGHSIGDAVLQSLGELLRNSTRKPDTACRLGGEEFVVILPETNAEGAALIAERLREATEQQLQAMVSVLTGPVTVSIGIATRGAGIATSEELLNRADEALYRAKSLGRNRVCHARELQTGPLPANVAVPPMTAACVS